VVGADIGAFMARTAQRPILRGAVDAERRKAATRVFGFSIFYMFALFATILIESVVARRLQ